MFQKVYFMKQKNKREEYISMKKFGLALLTLTAFISTVAIPVQVKGEPTEDIEINEVNFPDSVFREKVKTYDTNSNNILEKEELDIVTGIGVENVTDTINPSYIYSLKGIEFFCNLEGLDCRNNKISEIDLSHNEKLERLSCGFNELSKLDVVNNPNLEYLDCNNNDITELKISDSNKLKILYCNNNEINSLDISKNTNLITLECENNELTELDLKNNNKLSNLYISGNKLAFLNITNSSFMNGSSYYLGACYCAIEENSFDFNQFEDFNINNIYNLKGASLNDGVLTFDQGSAYASYNYLCGTSLYGANIYLTVSLTGVPLNCIQINEDNFPDERFRNEIGACADKLLEISGYRQDGYLNKNELEEFTSTSLMGSVSSLIGIENFPNLAGLAISGGNLGQVDLSKNTKLESLMLSKCNLSSIDISHQTKLKTLTCDGNNITELNLSNNTDLESLDCTKNKIKILDLTNNTELAYLSCRNNLISELHISEEAYLETLYVNNNSLLYLDINTDNLSNYEVSSQIIYTDSSKIDFSNMSGFNNNNVLSLTGASLYNDVLTLKSNTATYRYFCGLDSTDTPIYMDVTIYNITKANSLSITPSEIELTQGDSFMLTSNISPDGAAYQNVSWESSDNTIASVSSNGVVVANKPGDVTITCKTQDGSNIYAACKITVNAKEDNNSQKSETEDKEIVYTQTELFVKRLYNECLNREPDSFGLGYWSLSLDYNEKTGTEVAKGFIFSKEYKQKNTSDEEYIEMLYNVFLDRSSDADGKAHWLELLGNGVSREYVFRGFAMSQEYTNICNFYGIGRGSVTLTQARDKNPQLTAYVNRMYLKALERSGEEDGLNHWCESIQSASKTPEQVAEAFINSKEFQMKNLNDEEYVKVLYRTFMGREYDQSGLEHWLGELKRGSSREDVMHRFAISKEFQNIQASFGL